MDDGSCRLLHWIEVREARHAGEQAYFDRFEAALEALDRPSNLASNEAPDPSRAVPNAAASIGNYPPIVRVKWTRHMGWLVRRAV